MSRECGLEAKLRSPRESSSLREKTNEKCDAKEARGTAKHREGFIANRPLVSDQVELLQICRSMNVGYIYMAPTKVRCYEFVCNMAQPRTDDCTFGEETIAVATGHDELLESNDRDKVYEFHMRPHASCVTRP